MEERYEGVTIAQLVGGFLPGRGVSCFLTALLIGALVVGCKLQPRFYVVGDGCLEVRRGKVDAKKGQWVTRMVPPLSPSLCFFPSRLQSYLHHCAGRCLSCVVFYMKLQDRILSLEALIQLACSTSATAHAERVAPLSSVRFFHYWQNEQNINSYNEMLAFYVIYLFTKSVEKIFKITANFHTDLFVRIT